MSPQQTIAHYRITAKLGEGGMGAVYRATDTKLNRDVAIKVLPASLAENADRLARFSRESQILASLNHPNIASIYGVEERALVMELVEGPTLAERIAAGPVRLDEALGIAWQIADALEYAHEKGIVHRDIKPANVKVTPEGRVKVLDFGLAAVLQGAVYASAATDATDSPTLTISPTRAGMILGTAAYMSPEQARGTAVDQRADIWAFGLVLYEMLTGRAAFAGETVSDVLAAVMKEEPNLDAVPASVRPALARCLSKDRRARWASIGDVRWVFENRMPAAALPSHDRKAAVCVAIVAIVVAAAALWAPWRSAAPPGEVVRFQIAQPEGAAPGFALSPDGRKLVYFAAGPDGVSRLWVHAMDSLESRPLQGTEVTGSGVGPLFWSPDSRWVAYSDSGKLKKFDITGGPPQTLCSLSGTAVGGAWNREGVILFGSTAGPLMRVLAAGGVASPAVTLNSARKERYHLLPAFLPDGRHFLYLRNSSLPENNGIFVGSLDTRPDQQSTRRVAVSQYGAGFVPNGKSSELLLLRDGTLFAQPFDLTKLDVTGEPVPVADDVGWYLAAGLFSASSNGTLIYRRAAGGSLQFTLFDRKGKPSGTAGDAGEFPSAPAFSPDGKLAAVIRRDGQFPANMANLWLLDLVRDAATKFTFDTSLDLSPVWSPNGSQIVFSSRREGIYNLYRKPANSTREEEPLLKSDLPKYPMSWSRDGRFLLYRVDDPKTKGDLWVLPDPGGAAGSRQPMMFQGTEANEAAGTFSPDSRWIAYQSDESGRPEVYVREFLLSSDGTPQATAKRQISNGGGIAPSWRSDGEELIYLSVNHKTVVSATVSTEPAFSAEQPNVLFQFPFAPTIAPAISPDGKRFLAAMPAQQRGPEPFNVVLNFTASLKR
jgi:Tol biopolymer transport system component